MARLLETELADKEKIELYFTLTALMRIRERDWLQVQSGALDQGTWLAYKPGMLSTLSMPRTRKWWEGVNSDELPLFAQGFIDEVNADLEGWPIHGTDKILGVFN